MNLLENWLLDMLRKHGLTQPDGRPLYQYDLGEEDFSELAELLQNETGYGYVPSSWNSFWKCYVVFAALYFSYEHSGVWSWEPIDRQIGLQDWQIEERSDGIVRAARWFRREGSIQDIGKRFIGFAYFEGGLPTKAIEEHDQVYFARLIRAVRRQQKYSLQPDNLKRWVREDIENDPPLISVDQDHLCNVLTDGAMAMSTIMAKSKERSISSLTADDSALYETFNEAFPCFRISQERFRRFFEAVQAEVNEHDRKELLHIERTLTSSGDAFRMTLKVSVSTDARVLTIDEFAALSGIPKAQLPSRGGARLFCGTSCLALVQFRPGSEGDDGADGSVRLQPMGSGFRAKGAQALAPVQVELQLPNRTMLPVRLTSPAVMPLSADEPTIFRPDAADPSVWKIQGSGSVHVPGATFLPFGIRRMRGLSSSASPSSSFPRKPTLVKLSEIGLSCRPRSVFRTGGLPTWEPSPRLRKIPKRRTCRSKGTLRATFLSCGVRPLKIEGPCTKGWFRSRA